jgi:hypothetical protein
MAEKDVLFGTKVKHSGTFDFKGVYNLLYTWLVDQGYDLNEKSYKETIGSGGAKDIEIDWEATRKVSDYFKFMLSMKWVINGMVAQEVELDGVKQKINKGQFELGIKSVLLKDYEEKWTKSPFVKFLRGVYDKYIIKERVEQYEGKLIAELDEFVAQCKSFLSLTGRR